MKRTDDAPPGAECSCKRVESTSYHVTEADGIGAWEIESDEQINRCGRAASYRVTMPNGATFDVCGQHYHMLFTGPTDDVVDRTTRLTTTTTIV